MSQPFDVYHKWLGIPREKQPADYYRLFALEPFEENTDVIRRATARQIRYLQVLAAGSESELAKPLLEEPVTARRCPQRSQLGVLYL